MESTSFLVSVFNKRSLLVQTNEKGAKCAIDNYLSGTIDTSLYYILHNGRLVGQDDSILSMHTYHVVPRILGGKGGFGSMLRALGAQIEKTTNREACRDLSGRRMRDVNNEKRLREWVAKSSEREKAKEERRKERRERMKAPRYKFDDPEYEAQKACTSERLDEALQQGLQSGSSRTMKGDGKGKKRKADETEIDSKKAREWLGIDVNVDTDDSSSSSSASEVASGLAAAEKILAELNNAEGPDGGTVVDDPAGSSSSDEGMDRASSCAATCATTRDGDCDDCDSIVEGDQGEKWEENEGSQVDPDRKTERDNSGCSSRSQTDPNNEISQSNTSEATASDTSIDASCNVSETTTSCNESSFVSDRNDTSGEAVGISIVPDGMTAALAGTAEFKFPASRHNDKATANVKTELNQNAKSLALDEYDCASELEALGLDVLKMELAARGLKCGGTLQERAQRLFSVRGLQQSAINPSLLARPQKKK